MVPRFAYKNGDSIVEAFVTLQFFACVNTATNNLRYSGFAVLGVQLSRLVCAILGEYPFHQFRFGECPFPYVVVYASVLRVEGMTSGISSCRHPVTGNGHRNGLVGVPVKVPKRGVNRPCTILVRATSTTD